MSIPVAEIPESAADGALAETYADIRRSQGLPLVNLIWRHLATRAGALEWAWTISRPLYTSGSARREAHRLTRTIALPTIAAVPSPVLLALGISAAERRAITGVIEAYNRGNSLNLVALGALLDAGETPDRENVREPNLASDADGEPAAPLPALPPITAVEALTPEVRALVLALNEFGTAGRASPIVASLYRHLAPWPGYLALAWAQLAPLAADGRLDAIVAAVRRDAGAYAARAAQARGTPPQTVEPADASFARAAITRFVDTAISRMVPIGLMLSRSLTPAIEEPGA